MANADVPDTWERGDPYEQYIGRWSRRIAPKFLAWLRCAPGLHWLDIGCGTGALTAAILEHAVPASVTGIEPAGGFLRKARENLAGRAAFVQAGAAAIPFAARSFGVVASGLVLNFVPELHRAVAGMARVTQPGGVIGAYVWDYSGKMELIRLFWDAAVALDPGAAKLDEGSRFPLCHPEALFELFRGVGLAEVEVTAIDIPTLFRSFDEYWQPFLGGQGPAPAYVASLDTTARDRLRENLRERLPAAPDGTINLTARAWAVRAVAASST